MIRSASPASRAARVEVSVVMPCLNEEASVGSCVEAAAAALAAAGVEGEIIVADNGSTDRSAAIAGDLGARVVHQPIGGYGAACLAGIDCARGDLVIMGDADGSYDYSRIDQFLDLLREGHDLVIGSRYRGEILPGAMPGMHRYGGLFLTKVLNLLFGARVSDAHSGMRAFTREAWRTMALRTTRWDFASEMIAKAAMARLRIAEMPITYHPRKGRSKLKPFRGGWQNLRAILMLRLSLRRDAR